MGYKIMGDAPGPVAQAFLDDRSYFSAIMGPLGSGKTNTAILKILRVAEEQEPNGDGIRPVRLIAIRNTYPDLEATTIRDWYSITQPLGGLRMSHPPTQLMRWRMPDGSLVDLDVMFLALDREEHVRKLRGAQASIVWLNEMKELPKAVLDMATRALGRFPSSALGGVRCTRETMIGDFNAPDEDHWAATLMDGTTPGWRVFVQPGGVIKVGADWKPNPDAENTHNLPVDYYAKMLANKGEQWIRVNLANQLGSSVDGKPVHPEYNPIYHESTFDPDPYAPILCGQDYGLTPAAVLAQVIDGQLRIIDEIVTHNFSAMELAASIKERMMLPRYEGLAYTSGWGDPSGGTGSQADKNTPFRVMLSQGLPVQPAGKSNAFTPRREALGSRMKRFTSKGEPAILVHKRCLTLRKGLAGHYAFKRIKVLGDERYHDVPDKTIYSHVCEALQYLCVGLGDARDFTGGNQAANIKLKQGASYGRR
jgi:hypothetical protein